MIYRPEFKEKNKGNAEFQDTEVISIYYHLPLTKKLCGGVSFQLLVTSQKNFSRTQTQCAHKQGSHN